MSANAVRYDKEFHARAKAEGCTLVTLDINGKYAKASGVTAQLYVHENDEVEYLWEVFMWLSNGRYKGEPAPTFPKVPT